jgi:hypothetical protein
LKDLRVPSSAYFLHEFILVALSCLDLMVLIISEALIMN